MAQKETIVQKRKSLIRKYIEEYFDCGTYGTVKAYREACYKKAMDNGLYDNFLEYSYEEMCIDDSKAKAKFDADWIAEAKKFKRFLKSLGYCG